MRNTQSTPRLTILILSLCLLTACVPEVVRHNETGNAAYENEDYNEAIEAYRLAQVAEPDQAEPYYNAANSYNRQAQVDAALVQTQQALKTADPDLATQAWYNLGNVFFDTEQWEKAVEAYKEALRLTPDDEDAKHNLELALQKLQEQQQQAQQQQEQQQQEQEQDEEQQQQQGEEPTPSPQEQQEQTDEQQDAGEPQQEQTMTPEQAEQLLRTLLGDSQTLQERLREIYQVPGATPEEDW